MRDNVAEQLGKMNAILDSIKATLEVMLDMYSQQASVVYGFDTKILHAM